MSVHIAKSWAMCNTGETDILPTCKGRNFLLPLLRNKVNTWDIQCYTITIIFKL